MRWLAYVSMFRCDISINDLPQARAEMSSVLFSALLLCSGNVDDY